MVDTCNGLEFDVCVWNAADIGVNYSLQIGLETSIGQWAETSIVLTDQLKEWNGFLNRLVVCPVDSINFHPSCISNDVSKWRQLVIFNESSSSYSCSLRETNDSNIC